jgi:glycosyltransferase involved in cell wall biosynthesis
MNAPVSVVMPHYNALETVGRSIESVIAQSLPVHELVIVDDASTDFAALAQLVEHYASRLEIILIPLATNRGAANARNVGIASATSTYIAFLDSDDVWHPQKIALQYACMQAYPVNLTAHGYIFDLQKRPFEVSKKLTVKVIGKGNFIWGNPLFTPTVMVRKDRLIRFDPHFRRVDDYKCWYENLLNGNHLLLNLQLAGGYKQAVGASGLTGSARLMHQSYLEVLRSLRVEGKIPLGDYLLTVLCEMLKYPVRSFFIFLRK